MQVVVVNDKTALAQAVDYKFRDRIVHVVTAISIIIGNEVQLALLDIQVCQTLAFDKPHGESLPFLLQRVHHRALHYHPFVDRCVIRMLKRYSRCARVLLEIILVVFLKRFSVKT